MTLRRAGRARLFRLVSLAVLGALLAGPAQSEDLSEALRLWKFTFKLEVDAYGVQYMSEDLLNLAADQLEEAAGQTRVTNSEMTVCLEASRQLSKYFRAAGSQGSAEKRREIRARYEPARAGCLRLLGADPQNYPLGWPN
ncbi:MAG: hypothetical protein AAGF81_09385 [Pseudomonadota bacterium]